VDGQTDSPWLSWERKPRQRSPLSQLRPPRASSARDPRLRPRGTGGSSPLRRQPESFSLRRMPAASRPSRHSTDTPSYKTCPGKGSSSWDFGISSRGEELMQAGSAEDALRATLKISASRKGKEKTTGVRELSTSSKSTCQRADVSLRPAPNPRQSQSLIAAASSPSAGQTRPADRNLPAMSGS